MVKSGYNILVGYANLIMFWHLSGTALLYLSVKNLICPFKIAFEFDNSVQGGATTRAEWFFGKFRKIATSPPAGAQTHDRAQI